MFPRKQIFLNDSCLLPAFRATEMAVVHPIRGLCCLKCKGQQLKVPFHTPEGKLSQDIFKHMLTCSFCRTDKSNG